jgi:hypothetical protein
MINMCATRRSGENIYQGKYSAFWPLRISLKRSAGCLRTEYLPANAHADLCMMMHSCERPAFAMSGQWRLDARSLTSRLGRIE